jgi:hypothetical protein
MGLFPKCDTRVVVLGFLLNILIQKTSEASLSGSSNSTIIIPNFTCKLNPSTIEEEFSDNPVDSIYHFRIKCSEGIAKQFKFEPRANFCKGLSFRGTSSEINEVLTDVRVTSAEFNMPPNEKITYTMWDETMSAKQTSFAQTFTFESQLSITLAKDIIIFDKSKNSEINELVLTLDRQFEGLLPDYHVDMSISGKDQLKNSTLAPSWLRSKIAGNQIYLFGKPPSQFDENLKLIIVISELKSGLKSKPLKLTLVDIPQVPEDDFFAGFVTFFITFCFLIVGLVVVCVVKSSSYLTESEGPSAKYNKIHADLSGPQNVLSNSITNWEKNSTMKKENESEFSFSSQVEAYQDKQMIKIDAFVDISDISIRRETNSPRESH